MDYQEIEKILKESALQDTELPQSKEALKNVFVSLNRSCRHKGFSGIWKLAAFASGSLFIAAVFIVLVIEDNNQAGPTNNLGGVWSTFTDSSHGGSSKVWPPASNSCENLFVKSSPGFGDKGYAVRIKGTAGDNDSAFLGVSTFLSERASCPRCIGIDLRRYKGIRFKIKGESGRGNLLFVLPHQSREALSDRSSCISLTGYHDYQTDITGLLNEKWTDVKLVFRRDFRQPSGTPDSCKVNVEAVLEDENLIQWLWKGEKNQTIDLWIDNVELF